MEQPSIGDGSFGDVGSTSSEGGPGETRRQFHRDRQNHESFRLPARPVSVRKRKPAAKGLVKPRSPNLVGARVAHMENHGLFEEVRACALPARAQREVHLLEVEKVPLVETAESREQIAP